MKLTLLLDLDDTLLNSNPKKLIPTYFQALSDAFASQVAPNNMLRALYAGMRRMSESENFSRTLQQVFDAEFYSQVNISYSELQPAIEKFYDDIFSNLARLTSRNVEGQLFIEWAFSKGYRIAIAADPLLPRKAILERLHWAGFDPQQFELISTAEDFHFSKTHPAYYAEILGRMGWPVDQLLMIGRDVERDILPAKKLGLATYQINDESTSSFEPEAGPRGKLDDLRLWLEAIDPAALMPSFKSIDSILAIMYATPAVLNELIGRLDSTAWTRKPSPHDWSLTELVCHMRDTEREIHQTQIQLFTEDGEPFIPRPDTSVWASQRDYLHENGDFALKEFNEARCESLAMLKNLTDEEWERKARHAIFGPTNFIEVISFIADHDRMHIQQAWAALKKL